jgi:hypothetical protein
MQLHLQDIRCLLRVCRRLSPKYNYWYLCMKPISTTFCRKEAMRNCSHKSIRSTNQCSSYHVYATLQNICVNTGRMLKIDNYSILWWRSGLRHWLTMTQPRSNSGCSITTAYPTLSFLDKIDFIALYFSVFTDTRVVMIAWVTKLFKCLRAQSQWERNYCIVWLALL